MARNALSVNYGEVRQGVATGAFGVAVATFKDKAGAVSVIEFYTGPFFHRMAHVALEIQVLVRHLLCERPSRRNYER